MVNMINLHSYGQLRNLEGRRCTTEIDRRRVTYEVATISFPTVQQRIAYKKTHPEIAQLFPKRTQPMEYYLQKYTIFASQNCPAEYTVGVNPSGDNLVAGWINKKANHRGVSEVVEILRRNLVIAGVITSYYQSLQPLPPSFVPMVSRTPISVFKFVDDNESRNIKGYDAAKQRYVQNLSVSASVTGLISGMRRNVALVDKSLKGLESRLDKESNILGVFSGITEFLAESGILDIGKNTLIDSSGRQYFGMCYRKKGNTVRNHQRLSYQETEGGVKDITEKLGEIISSVNEEIISSGILK